MTTNLTSLLVNDYLYVKILIERETFCPLFCRMLSSPLQMRDGDQQVDAHVRQGEGLSVTAEDSNITNVPFRILTQMFTDAKGIINSQSGIVDVRGQTGHGYFVLNKLKMGDPLTLKYNEKTKTISCSSKCHSWNGYKICCHTIALAEHLGKLKSVLDRYVKSKKGVQLTDIANTDMSSSRGKKASKATERRKGPANKPTADSVDYVRETEPKQSNEESNQTITSTAQMFHVTFLAGLIKKCYGCGQEFSGRQRVSPNDLILKSFENRIYTSPRSKMVKKSSNLQNTYYHLNTDCVRKRHPNFEMKHVLVHEEIKESLTKKHCNVLRQKNIEV